MASEKNKEAEDDSNINSSELEDTFCPFVPQKYALERAPSSFVYTQTAYMYFLEEQRERILNDEELKFKSQKEFKSYLKNLWVELDERQKTKYRIKADKDQKRFEAVLETMNAEQNQ